MSDTQLVLATKNDASLLQDSALAAFQEDFNLYGGFPPNIESLTWFDECIENKQFYKILYKNAFAGGLCIEDAGEGVMDIRYIYVSDAFQNNGVGQAVMSMAETLLPNIKQIYLLTPYKAYRNHYFYEKLGFKKVGEFHPDPDDEFMVFEYQKYLHE
ncbi:GNAT family N-acetyltransferase [Enterovibrio sp. ZSDZ35]|uniref:GNAT family N-acetyltransferase n=1 Tax=Enterovibrio qingdaonensis TaxID=2899818 RepID=A0ABT5QH94_9GAMM|nr:GNAT family N-acetyltransferase [Enterovibrio sp. ZSDZ35]MDD1780328.1 GNAT family N-acetyltransferase [Enterovibrio sp. ZSDZ35]